MGYRTSSIEIIVGTLTITDAALAAFEQEHEIGMVGNGLRLGAPTRGRADANSRRERVWLSPHCVGERQPGLFGGAA